MRVYIYNYILLNLIAISLVFLSWERGWIDIVLEMDKFHLVKVIVVFFIYYWLIAAQKVIKFNQEILSLLNHNYSSTYVKDYFSAIKGASDISRYSLSKVLISSMVKKVIVIRRAASNLVYLGLAGTIFGVIFALSNIDPRLLADFANLVPTMTNMLLGLNIALYTTLIGTVLSIWLVLCYYILESMASSFAGTAIAIGEVDAKNNA